MSTTQIEVETKALELPVTTGSTKLVKLAYYLPPDVPRAPSIYDLELINGSRDQDTVELSVNDVRGREAEFKINHHGFQYIKVSSKTNIEDFASDDKIEELYFPEVEQWLMQL